ncbi:MAG TPA: acetyl-CoA carboxylase biotin carboxyl carrier protein subunit [Patescibacteria group bacterium]
MTIYRVVVDDCEFRVEILSGNNEINAELIEFNNTGEYSICNDDQEAQSVIFANNEEILDVFLEGKFCKVFVEKENGRVRQRDFSTINGDIISPMPGVVIKTWVKQGDKVKKGQSVILMESMKMHVDLRAALDGVVGRVLFDEKSVVEKGSVLVEIFKLDED